MSYDAHTSRSSAVYAERSATTNGFVMSKSVAFAGDFSVTVKIGNSNTNATAQEAMIYLRDAADNNRVMLGSVDLRNANNAQTLRVVRNLSGSYTNLATLSTNWPLGAAYLRIQRAGSIWSFWASRALSLVTTMPRLTTPY